MPTTDVLIDDRLLVAKLTGSRVVGRSRAALHTTSLWYHRAGPDEIGLPDSRVLVPAMVEIAGRHPRLNVLNIEAAAAARLLRARVLLSPPAAGGVLAPVLDMEGIPWEIRDPDHT